MFANPVGATSFPENRGGESTLGNFVADVQKWALNQNTSRPVDIAFMIRAVCEPTSTRAK